MNERMRQLYEQAHSVRVYDGDPMREGNPPTVYWQGEVSAQRFAELIVRECTKFCDDVIKEVEIAMEQCEMVKTSDRLMMLHDGTRNGAKMSKNRIKQHFGVEE